MKLLIATDIHGNKRHVDNIRKKVADDDVDFIIVAGDLTVFERDLDDVLADLNSIGLPVMIIPGNHESPEVLSELCAGYDNLIYLHHATYEIDDYIFVGFGNPGFATIEPEFEKFVGNIKKAVVGKKIILITHGPPYNTKLDYLGGDHVGCKSITKFIKNNDNIVIAVSGHIHENFGVKDKLNKISLVNPGPNGEIVDV